MSKNKSARGDKNKDFHDANSQKNRLKKKLITKKPPTPLTGKELVSMMRRAFAGLNDPRRTSGNFHYLLGDIAVACAIAMFYKAETLEVASCFIEANGEFLRSLGLFRNKETQGHIPSRATIDRILRLCVDPDDFRHRFFVFMRLACSIAERKGLRIIAGDGKAMRGTQCGVEGKPIVMLTAFDTQARLPIMTVNCKEKSNEITAWQTLLKKLVGVTGAVFTADAMGCQYKIVEKIVGGGNHYCIAVKGNQKGLEEDAATLIQHSRPYDTYTEKEVAAHGRIESRHCEVYRAKDPSGGSFIMDIDKWKGLATIVRVTSHVEYIKTGDKRAEEERIFISDLSLSAEEFNHIARSHWLVEVFHWMLDVNFAQDQIKRRNDVKNKASRNLDLIQKLAYAIGIIFLAEAKKDFPNEKLMGLSRLMAFASSNPDALRVILTQEMTSFSCADFEKAKRLAS